MPRVLKANQRWWEKVGTAETREGMNAISIQAGTASTLWNTCKNIICHPVREWKEGNEDKMKTYMTRQTDDRRGRKRVDVEVIQTLKWYLFWLICYLVFAHVFSQKLLTTMNNSWPLYKPWTATLNTYVNRVWEKLPQRWMDTKPSLASEVLCSGSWYGCFQLARPMLLTRCTCLTLWPRGPVLPVQFQHESVFEA